MTRESDVGFVPDIYQRIGERVAFLREARGLTQEKLAGLVGLNRTSISNLEAGKQETPLYTLVLIAAALDTKFTVLTKGIVP